MRTIQKDYQKEWLSAFQAYLKQKDRSPLTISGYIHDIKLFLKWLHEDKGPMSLDKIIGVDLIGYRQYLQKKAALKGSTINRRIQSIRQFFGWAFEQGLVESDISHEVRFLRSVKPQRPASLTPRESNALLRAAASSRGVLSKRNFALIQLLLQTGIRVAEVRMLDFNDLKISQRSGTVRIQYGEGMKEREIPLNSAARKAILAYVHAINPSSAPGPLIRSERGTALSVRAIQMTVMVLAKKAKITRIPVSPHTLRHTFAINFLKSNQGKSVELAALLGHDSLDTTAIYAQPSREDLQDDVERLTQ